MTFPRLPLPRTCRPLPGTATVGAMLGNSGGNVHMKKPLQTKLVWVCKAIASTAGGSGTGGAVRLREIWVVAEGGPD